MPTTLRPLAKCASAQNLHTTDVHWAAEQSVSDARAVLGWSQSRLAKELDWAVHKVRRLERGETTVNPLVFEVCPEFATAFWDAFEARKAEIQAKRQAA